MGLFGTKIDPELLQKNLQELSDRIYSLETAHKRLGLEWEELYDKVRHQMSRMSKRVSVDKAANGGVPEEVDDPAGLAGMDPISAKILARRHGQAPPK